MISNSNRKFGDFSNQRCIAPSGKYENRYGNCDDEDEDEKNRIDVNARIYDPRNIVSLDG